MSPRERLIVELMDMSSREVVYAGILQIDSATHLVNGIMDMVDEKYGHLLETDNE